MNLKRLFSKKTKILGIPLIYLLISATTVLAIYYAGFLISGSFLAVAGTEPAPQEFTINWSLTDPLQLEDQNSRLYTNSNGAKDMQFTLIEDIDSTDPLCTYEQGKDVRWYVKVDETGSFTEITESAPISLPIIEGTNTITVKLVYNPAHCPMSGTYSLSGD
jgi:hypothetical protein